MTDETKPEDAADPSGLKNFARTNQQAYRTSELLVKVLMASVDKYGRDQEAMMGAIAGGCSGLVDFTALVFKDGYSENGKADIKKQLHIIIDTYVDKVLVDPNQERREALTDLLAEAIKKATAGFKPPTL